MDALEEEPYQFEPTGPVHDSKSGSSLDVVIEDKDWTLKTHLNAL